MTADALRMEAFKANALKKVELIDTIDEFAFTRRQLFDDMNRMLIPDSVREPIVEALEEKRVKVAKRAGAA